jgi:hypothetical protein
MPFVNMTPHALNVFNSDNPGEVLSLPPSGQSVRVAQTFQQVGMMDNVNVYRAVYGAVETIDNATKAVVGGLPEPVEGTTYIVSGQALEAVKASGRSDFAAPGELVRDDKGQPVGCNGLKIN